ncbi:MAG: hypothetical protein A2Z35_01990 [Actinobacteria bacterium RBG_19FT_COMBO_36_27]|nr:MAG: hypothetical protein A2Z35_01990 [Actinobacteria bacterium RBG_19FT_COMBO_36_27]
MLAQIANSIVLLLVKSIKLPSERRKMFAERIANDILFLPKGFLIRFNTCITGIYNSIYNNIKININDIFNIIIKINYK